MNQRDKTGQNKRSERDQPFVTRCTSCMDFGAQYLMIPGFEGCTPIYNNHATTAFSMVLTPSRLVQRITRLIFVSYEEEWLKSVKCSRIQLWSRPSHPSASPSSANHCNLPKICFLNIQTQAALSQSVKSILGVWHLAGGEGSNLTRVHSCAVRAITIWQLEAQCQDIQACHTRWLGYCHHFMVTWFWCEIIVDCKS